MTRLFFPWSAHSRVVARQPFTAPSVRVSVSAGTDRKRPETLSDGSFAERTLQNVKDSEGTIVIYFNELRSGTDYTVQCGKQLQRPHKLINAANISPQEAAKLIVYFVRERKIDILNVAGPRQSEWSEGYDYAFRALEIFLDLIGPITSRSKK